MDLDGGNRVTHATGPELPGANRLEVDPHGGYLYAAAGSELLRMPLTGNTFETVCSDRIIGGSFAFISVDGLHQYGDADLDDDVDVTDFNSLAQNFGGSNRNWYQGNFDGDEGVDISDFWLLSLHFSPNGYDKLSFLNSNSIAPEPGTVFLIVIGTILLSLWRTRGLKIL